MGASVVYGLTPKDMTANSSATGTTEVQSGKQA